MALAIFLPLERCDFLLATTGQQQEPDDRHMHREGLFMLFQHHTKPADLLSREEALPSPSSVSLGPRARIAALAPVTVGLRACHDDGENRRGTVGSHGRRVEGSEPFLHISNRNVCDLVAPKPRQYLVAIIASVDRKRSGLPATPITGKDFLGDRLELGLFRKDRTAAPDRPLRAVGLLQPPAVLRLWRTRHALCPGGRSSRARGLQCQPR